MITVTSYNNHNIQNLSGNKALDQTSRSSRMALPMLLGTMILTIALFAHSANAHAQTLSAPSATAGTDPSAGALSTGRPLLKIEAAFDAGIGREAIRSARLSDPEAVSRFYAARGGAPLWLNGRGLNQRALDLISALDQAWTHGLNPAQYHLARIESMLDDPQGIAPQQLELLLTDAVIRYGRDLTGTRPGLTRGPYDISRKSWSATEILDVVARTADLNKAIKIFEPQGILYQTLRKELASILSEKNEGGAQTIDFDGTPLLPGETHPSVSALRARLGLSATHASDTYYDENLVAAVMAFQRKHRLNADGVVGPNTLRILNRDRAGKIRQILANLERLRWLDQNRPERYIIVNIPSQTLWLVHNRTVTEEMKVIVGKPVRGTKDFKTMITGVRFNPTWTVPPTIKRKDFLPRLIENPHYLKEKGIAVLQKKGGRMVRVDSSSIDWASVSGSDLAQMSMVQSAGDSNALGKIRVLMPNPYDMYLHDTSAPELFAEEERTLSSGCIRIEKPEAVADFILASNAGWGREKMDSLIAAGRTVDIPAEIKIPVYVIYQTIWLDSNGTLVYGDDIYGRDAALLNTLDKANSLPYFKS